MNLVSGSMLASFMAARQLGHSGAMIDDFGGGSGLRTWGMKPNKKVRPHLGASCHFRTNLKA